MDPGKWNVACSMGLSGDRTVNLRKLNLQAALRALAASAGLTGLLVLGSWRLDADILERIGPGLSTMLVLAASTVVLTSLLLWNAWSVQRIEGDRSAAQRRANESEERLRLLVEHALDLIVIVGPGGVIRYVSPASTRLLGYSPEEVVGMSPERYEHPDDLTKLVQSRARALEQPGVAIGPVQVRVRHRDGSWRHVEVVHRNLMDEPSVCGIVTYSHDVTERVHAQIVLDQRERYFRALIEGAYDLVTVMRADGTIRYTSPSVERLIGWSPQELSGSQILDLIHPDDLPEVERALGSLAATPGASVAVREARVRHKDGSWRVLEWAARSCVDDAVIAGIVVNSRDVTERRRAEDELMASLQLQEAIIEGTADMVFVKDAEGHYLTINAAGAVMLGREKQEVIGKTDHDLFPPEQAAFIRETDQRVMTSGQPLAYESSGVGRDGGVHTYLMTKAQWRDTAGRVIGVLGMSLDITARKRTEDAMAYARDQAREAVQLKSEFIANLSHEVRTPMNAVIGFTDIVLDSDLSTEQRDHLLSVRSSAEKLLGLLNDILDLSKLEMGSIAPESAPLSLREVVHETIDMFAAHGRQKGILLTSDVTPDVPDRVEGDATRLRQVLVNLVGNAVKFTEAGEVTVRLWSEADAGGAAGVHFTVADTGIGIPADKQHVIFEPFVQGDGSMTRQHGGTGLGLAIAKQVVGLMGGRLWVESSEGHGSVFHFTMRFTPTAVASHPGSRTTAPEPRDGVGMIEEGAPRAPAPVATAATPLPLRGRVLVAEDGPDSTATGRRPS